METTTDAAVARAVITPPVGIPLVGFAGRPPSTGVHDELTATALVLRSGDTAVALVCCDLLDFGAELTASVRAAAGDAAGLPPEHVLLSASHNHYGPALGDWEAEPSPLVSSYVGNLRRAVAGLVSSACRRLTPATLSAGTGHTMIGVNRRERTPDGRIVLGQNPSGPVDHTVRTLRVDRADGAPLALVVNHACHGVSLDQHCTEITADFPGIARNVVEEHTGATCLFLQGAAGDVNPVFMDWDWANPDRLGRALGAAAVGACHDAEPASATPLAVRARRLALPPMLPAGEDEARAAIAAIEAEPTGQDPGIAGEDAWRRRRIERLEHAIEVLRGRAPTPVVDAELTAVAFGRTVAVVTAPAEMFTELGRHVVTASPFPHTLYAGYTNGMIGYVPTRSAYTEGGYEVTHGCSVAPEAGELIERSSVQLLHEVHGEVAHA